MKHTRSRTLTASLRSSVRPEEKLQFAELAKHSGFTLSQWIRHKLLQQTQRPDGMENLAALAAARLAKQLTPTE